MKNTAKEIKTRRAYFLSENGSKQWFDIPTETAQKVLRLQKMFKKERQKKELSK